MNSSHYNQLVAQLQGLLTQLNRTSADLANLTCTGKPASGKDRRHAYLYILLIMAFYAFLTGGLILAYTRSNTAKSQVDHPGEICSRPKEGKKDRHNSEDRY